MARMRSTVQLVEQAAKALLDPEQTTVPTEVAAPLSHLLSTMAENNRVAGIDVDKIPGARETALAVLAAEHARVTA